MVFFFNLHVYVCTIGKCAWCLSRPQEGVGSPGVPAVVSYLVDHSAQGHQAISSAPKLAFYNGLTLVQLPCASVSICNVSFTFQVCECLAISSLSWSQGQQSVLRCWLDCRRGMVEISAAPGSSRTVLPFLSLHRSFHVPTSLPSLILPEPKG